MPIVIQIAIVATLFVVAGAVVMFGVSAKMLVEQVQHDREQMRALLTTLESLVAQGVLSSQAKERIEASGARIEAASAVVASDLADAHVRADKVNGTGQPGEAADAASRSPLDGEHDA
jgi:hypothetical protein